jgi:peptidoglycan hydrolase CwlO-like protein
MTDTPSFRRKPESRPRMFWAPAFAGVTTLAFALGMAPSLKAADTHKTKESYVQKTEDEVQEWTAKLKSLQERSEKSGSETRQELDQHVKVVDDKLQVARQKLENLRASSEDSWKSMRKGLDDALRDVRRAWRNAQSFFNKNENKRRSI